MSFGSSSPGGSPDGIGGNESGIGSSSDGGGNTGQGAVGDFFSAVGKFTDSVTTTIGKAFTTTTNFLDEAVTHVGGKLIGAMGAPVTGFLDLFREGSPNAEALEGVGRSLGHGLFTATRDNVVSPVVSNLTGAPANSFKISDSQGNVYEPSPIMGLLGVKTERAKTVTKSKSKKGETTTSVHGQRLYRGNSTSVNKKRVIYK
jgi:hypothetical protein